MQKYKKSVDSREMRLNPPRPDQGKPPRPQGKPTRAGNILLAYFFLILFLLISFLCTQAQTRAQWDSIVVHRQFINISNKPPVMVGRDSIYHSFLLPGSRVVDVRERGSYTRVISYYPDMIDLVHRDTLYFPTQQAIIKIRVGMFCAENPRAEYIRQQGDLLLKAHDGSGERAYLLLMGYTEKQIKKYQANKKK